jgi:peptidyl-tRNA hydrolase, PTH1 family
MFDKRRRLIVGLGNPGPAYASARHNIGFMAVDRLVATYGLTQRTIRLPPQSPSVQLAGSR